MKAGRFVSGGVSDHNWLIEKRFFFEGWGFLGIWGFPKMMVPQNDNF